jgi:hypothetical protein
MSALDSPEKALEQLAALKKEHGENDSFTVRVLGKKPGTFVPTALAVFNGATLEQIAQAESWVGRLVGGGEWTISVNHSANIGRRVGFVISVPGPTYSTPDFAATTQSDWSGPANVVQTSVTQGQQQNTVPPPSQQGGFSIPRPAPASIPYTGAGAAAATAPTAVETERLMLIQREENRARAELEAAKAQLQQQQAEARFRKEMEEREAKLKMEFLSQRKPEKEGPGITEVLSALTAAVSPIITAMIQSNNEFKRTQMELQQRLAEQQAQAQERQTALLLKLTERPSTSPEMTAMLEMTKAQSESQGVMMGRIVDAMSVVSKTSVSMIETIAEISAPPEGSPVLDAVKEGTKALMALAGGAESGARKAIKTQQQLPAATQAANQQAAARQAAQQGRAPTQQEMQRASHQAMQQQVAAQQAAQQPKAPVVEAKPVEVVTFKESPPPNMPQAFDDLPDGFGNVKTKSVVDELEELIREEHRPVEAVVQFLIDALRHPEMQAALNEVGGEPSALLAKRLGVEWVLGHQEYLTELGETLERMGAEQGIFEADEEEGEEAAR